MLAYRPTSAAPGAALVVVLHGCDQTAVGYAAGAGWQALADRYGFVVLAPEQSAHNSVNLGFNWFRPADARRDSGEAASIRAMIARATSDHELDPSQVYIAGLSAGGAMALVMLAAYPDVFAGGSIVAGLPYGVANNLWSACRLLLGASRQSASALGDRVRQAAPEPSRWPTLIIWQGDADRVVKAANAVAIAHQWASVQALRELPDATATSPRRTQQVWRAPETGEAVIVLNMLHGQGHGAPLSSLGHDGVGTTGPFLLEAGISSAFESLQFWGLVEARNPDQDRSGRPRRKPPAAKVRQSRRRRTRITRIWRSLPRLLGKALGAITSGQ